MTTASTESSKSNGKKNHSVGRGKRPQDESEDDSDDSDVPHASTAVPRKKTRGQVDDDDDDEVHHMQEAPRVKEKTQRAAKKVGGASTSSHTSTASAAPSRANSKKSTTSTKASPPSRASSKGVERKTNSTENKIASNRASSARTSAIMDTDDSEEDVEEVYDSQDEVDEDEDSLEISVEEEGQIDIKWPSLPTKTEAGISYYAWVEIDGVRISRGDSVYLRSGAKMPFIGKLVELKQDEKHGSTCSIAWWYRKGDVRETMEAKELMESTHTETNPLQSVSITRRPKILFGRDPKTKSLASQQPDTFFYYRFFDNSTSKVQTL